MHGYDWLWTITTACHWRALRRHLLDLLCGHRLDRQLVVAGDSAALGKVDVSRMSGSGRWRQIVRDVRGLDVRDWMQLQVCYGRLNSQTSLVRF